MDLFRQEAIKQQTDRLYGDVILLPTLSHKIVLSVLMLWIAALTIWAANSNYSQKETIEGWLEPSTGIIKVYAHREGIYTELFVEEGDRVLAGQKLAIIKEPRALMDGDNLNEKLNEQYTAQLEALNIKLESTDDIYTDRTRSLLAELNIIDSSLELIVAQKETLKMRATIAAQQTERFSQLKLQGHVSSINIEQVESNELLIKSDFQDAERDFNLQRNRKEQVQAKLAILPFEQEVDKASISSQISILKQEILKLSSNSSYILKAPRDGTVSNLQVTSGQRVRQTYPPMTIVPKESFLVAHFLVPVRSIGFIKPGLEIAMRYDAFPYQKFGMYSSVVDKVSDSILLPEELLNSPISAREPMYRISAVLNKEYISVGESQLKLKPGMTISADVILNKRTLIEWFLEPFYTLRGRI